VAQAPVAAIGAWATAGGGFGQGADRYGAAEAEGGRQHGTRSIRSMSCSIVMGSP